MFTRASTRFRSLFAFVILSTATATPGTNGGLPTVHLDKTTVVGASFGNLSQFLGIPFAQPPVGNLRFNLPKPVAPYSGLVNATQYGPACPQQTLNSFNVTGFPTETLQTLHGVTGPTNEQSEDCLSINVVVPATATPHSKLPIVAWIYGGGFQVGATISYNGSAIVERSIALGEPIIYVSMNYRLSALGFLASKEIQEAGVGNAAMFDQRLALQWIQKYISEFGGDPSKVTIWGQSAGAIAVAFQLVANNSDTSGLFHGAIMSSGSPLATGTLADGQPHYDALVSASNCTGIKDTLACLRAAPFEVINAAMQASPNLFSFNSPVNSIWRPRVDGVLWKEDPLELVSQGKVARVPFITGDCDDEGTQFALPSRNLTTEAELRAYVQQLVVPGGSSAQIDKLLQLYPQDVTQGSPFGTGTQNALTPVYKQFAAIAGDVLFQAARRFFLQNTLGRQGTWAYLSKRLKSIPITGSFHGSDLFNAYQGGELQDYIIHFVNHFDPNGLNPQVPRNLTVWPQYTNTSPPILTFNDGPGEVPVNITQDTYRLEPIEFVTELLKAKLTAFASTL